MSSNSGVKCCTGPGAYVGQDKGGEEEEGVWVPIVGQHRMGFDGGPNENPGRNGRVGPPQVVQCGGEPGGCVLGQ